MTRLVWLGLLVVACAVVYAPFFDQGYMADDYFHLAKIEGQFGPHRHPWSNYVWASEDAANIEAHRRRGSLPWWTTDDWRFGMFRPLASLSLEIDHRWFNGQPFVGHLRSFLWLLAMVIAGERLIHRIVASVGLQGRMALVAVVVGAIAFALHEPNAQAFVWIANRCAFMSAAFGLVALEAHLTWREGDADNVEDAALQGAFRREWIAWVLAFAAGEYALTVAAYAFAYELTRRDAPVLARLRALLPVLACTLAFFVAYTLSGASSMGLAEYASPTDEPARFLEVLSHRYPRLLGELFASFPSHELILRLQTAFVPGLSEAWGPDGWNAFHDPYRHALLSLGALSIFAAALGVSWSGLRVRERHTAVWLLLGTLCALVPLGATFPQTRLLVVPRLGAAALLALMVVAMLRGWTKGHTPRSIAAIRTLLVGVAFVLLLPSQLLTMRVTAHRVAIVQHSKTLLYASPLPDLIEGAEEKAGESHVVFLSQAHFIPTVHGYTIAGRSLPKMPDTFHTLALGVRPYLVRTIDDHTVEIESVGQPWFSHRDERSFRREALALRDGQAVDVGLFRAQVAGRDPDGAIRKIRFRFDRPLDDPSLLFIQATEQGPRPVDLSSSRARWMLPLAQIPGLGG